jgi:hypothetical protein
MDRFATPLRLSIILVVALACGTLATLIPSPYHEGGSMSAGRMKETSAPDETGDMTQSATPDFEGVDVDRNRLTYVSNVS